MVCSMLALYRSYIKKIAGDFGQKLLFKREHTYHRSSKSYTQNVVFDIPWELQFRYRNKQQEFYFFH